jgi:hypothetical protein
MRKLLILISCLFFISISHGQFFGSTSGIVGGGGGGGGNVAITGSPDLQSNIGETTHTLTGIASGTKFIITTGTGASGADGLNAGVSDNLGAHLTWTKVADATAVGGGAEIYISSVFGGGSITITVDWFPLSNTIYQSSVCYTVSNAETSAGGATQSTTSSGQGVPNVSLTTTRANSIIFVVSSDFNAVDGGSGGSGITFRGTPTLRGYHRNSSNGTVVHYTYAAETATGYTIGWTAPDAGDPTVNTCSYEVRGN